MTNANPTTNTAATIADQLGETAPGARATIWRTVRTLGPEQAQAFVAQALEVEANGGMLVPDGSPPSHAYDVAQFLCSSILWRPAYTIHG